MLLPMPHKGQMLVLQVTLEQRVPQSATAVKLEAANWELFCDYPRRVSPVCRRCKSSMWLLRPCGSLCHNLMAFLLPSQDVAVMFKRQVSPWAAMPVCQPVARLCP